MNIVLINPRLKAWSPNVWVPLGLTYIAAVLEQEGHRWENPLKSFTNWQRKSSKIGKK